MCFDRGAAVPPGAEEEIPRCEQIPMTWWLGGLAASTALCTAILSPTFDLPVWSLVAVLSAACWLVCLSHVGKTPPWGSLILPCTSMQSMGTAIAPGVAAAGGRRNRAAGGAVGRAGGGDAAPGSPCARWTRRSKPSAASSVCRAGAAAGELEHAACKRCGTAYSSVRSSLRFRRRVSLSLWRNARRHWRERNRYEMPNL